MFDWENAIALHAMQGNRASSRRKWKVSWVFSSCAVEECSVHPISSRDDNDSQSSNKEVSQLFMTSGRTLVRVSVPQRGVRGPTITTPPFFFW